MSQPPQDTTKIASKTHLLSSKTASSSLRGCPSRGSENKVGKKAVPGTKVYYKLQPFLPRRFQKRGQKNEYGHFLASDGGLETPKSGFGRSLKKHVDLLSEFDQESDGFWTHFGMFFQLFIDMAKCVNKRRV